MPRTPRNADYPSARSGFTLTELMVVAVIIGVMAAMGVPSFQRAIEQSRADVAAANLRAIWAAERLFWLENRTYTTDVTALQTQGLLDSSLPITEQSATCQNGGYYYAVISATDTVFTARATRTDYTGYFQISNEGVLSGTVSAGNIVITPGFQ